MTQLAKSSMERGPKKQIDMGLWLTILFGLVLLVGFAMMLIDSLLG